MNATIEYPCNPELLLQALGPEKFGTKRSCVKIDRMSNSVRFTVTAEDTVALRVTINSITKLLTIYEQIDNGNKRNATEN